MKLVGHRTESIYRRYAIADEGMLRAGTDKLAALHLLEQTQVQEQAGGAVADLVDVRARQRAGARARSGKV